MGGVCIRNKLKLQCFDRCCSLQTLFNWGQSFMPQTLTHTTPPWLNSMLIWMYQQSFLSFLLLQIQQGVQQKVKEVEPVHRKGGEGLQLHSRPSKCNSAVQAVCYWGFATDCKEKARWSTSTWGSVRCPSSIDAGTFADPTQQRPRWVFLQYCSLMKF